MMMKAGVATELCSMGWPQTPDCCGRLKTAKGPAAAGQNNEILRIEKTL
jgi:hypothetical protein